MMGVLPLRVTRAGKRRTLEKDNMCRSHLELRVPEGKNFFRLHYSYMVHATVEEHLSPVASRVTLNRCKQASSACWAQAKLPKFERGLLCGTPNSARWFCKKCRPFRAEQGQLTVSL